MSELLRIILVAGPPDPRDLLLLTVLATCADDRGTLRGSEPQALAELARLPLQTFRRHLNRLDADDWIFVFGRGPNELAEYFVDIKKLCSIALNLGVDEECTRWAEARMGVVPFPRKRDTREALRK